MKIRPEMYLSDYLAALPDTPVAFNEHFAPIVRTCCVSLGWVEEDVVDYFHVGQIVMDATLEDLQAIVNELPKLAQQAKLVEDYELYNDLCSAMDHGAMIDYLALTIICDEIGHCIRYILGTSA